LQNNLSIGGVAFNQQENKILTNHNGTGIYNIYELAIADTTLSPLTHSKTESFFADDYVPGTENIIFSHDQGGNENDHVYLQRAGDTSARDLTPWPNSKNQVTGWSEDKKSLFISSNRRNPKFFDTWKLDTAGWKETMFYKNN
jgi:hypothetical protein